jgi:hypothetical protein
MSEIPSLRTVMCDPLIRRYWEAKTPEEERAAYVEMLAAGFPPSYGETLEEAAALIRRMRPSAKLADIPSVTRDIARGG